MKNINIFPKKLKSFWACTWACAQRLVLDLKVLVWFILVLLRLSFDEILILCGVLFKLSPLCLKAYISMLIMSCVRLIDFPHATIASILGYFLLYRVLQSMPRHLVLELKLNIANLPPLWLNSLYSFNFSKNLCIFLPEPQLIWCDSISFILLQSIFSCLYEESRSWLSPFCENVLHKELHVCYIHTLWWNCLNGLKNTRFQLL